MAAKSGCTFEYEVNEHGHVLEVTVDRRTGRRVSESMVYGLTGDGEPYTKWHGERYYLPEEDAERAREAREAYRAWMLGYGSDPAWEWEEVEV
jgi:hypothetical protein